MQTDKNMIMPNDDLRVEAGRIIRLIESGNVEIRNKKGESSPLPPALSDSIVKICWELVDERAVWIESLPKRVSFRLASAVLGTSVKYLEDLIAEGQLVADDGDEPGILLSSLVAYHEESSKRQRKALAELIRISEDLGI